MENCIFCKIIRGDLPSAKVWEDEDFLAILDINPNTKGMTLLLTKEHLDSYINDLPSNLYDKYFKVIRVITEILEKGLNVKRIAVVIEGLGINHAHIKLYPIHGLKNRFEEKWSSERVYFERYEGYISTQIGPNKDIEELQKLAEEIKKLNS